jgi:hypothetical protein
LYYDIKALYEIDFLNNECGCTIVVCHVHDVQSKKKILNVKIKDGNQCIKSTRQMKAQVDTTPKKKKSKQSTKKRVKILCK